jgi:hypothetical protein
MNLFSDFFAATMADTFITSSTTITTKAQNSVKKYSGKFANYANLFATQWSIQ